MDELRAAVRGLATAPSAALADDFVARLSGSEPSAELAGFIGDTLELAALHEIRDTVGVSVRWRLVDRLLSLGFPHALHVTPDDLDYHRSGATVLRGPAGFTLVVSLFSSLWYLAGLVLTVLPHPHSHGSRGAWFWVVLAGFLGAFLHSAAATVASATVTAPRRAQWLRTLGWMFFIAPAAAALYALVEDFRGAIAGLVIGAPAMLTAVLCALIAAKSGSVKSLPVRERLPEAKPAARIRRATPVR